jgi:adenylate cyclase
MDDAPRSTPTEPAAPEPVAPEPAEPGAVPVTAVRDTTEGDEMWRQILTGEDPHLPQMRRLWRHVPSSPRCKLCGAPFGGLGKVATKFMMHGPSNVNPLLCSLCFGQIRQHPGGAEVPIAVLFADIRGSTGIAERTSATAFGALVQRFYRKAARAIDDHNGIIDKFLGDGIMVLFIPVITGELLALRAIETGQAILREVEDPELVAGGVRVGVGVHAGEAFVGAIGSDERLDFTALGDTVNIAARLGSDAGAGELLVSAAAWHAAGRAGNVERRELTVKGRTEALEVVVVRASTEVAVA